MLTFYDYQAAPSPRRARIFLAEKGIEYDCKQVDIRAGEQLSDEFKAINPRCACLLYTSPSPRDKRQSRMPSSA